MPIAKKRITTIYPRDVRALAALARCGYVTREQLGQFLRAKRIEGYVKDGLVEKVHHSYPGNRSDMDTDCYRLTRLGRDFCRRELSLTSLYTAQNPNHDLALSERYFSLSASERESWRTEGQSRSYIEHVIAELRQQGDEERAKLLWESLQDNKLSMPDAVYTTDSGVVVALEVITVHYGHEEIIAKETAAQLIGADKIEFVRA